MSDVFLGVRGSAGRLRTWAAALATAAVSALAQAAPQDYDLPAQPLESAVKAVGKASGLSIALDARLAAGKLAPAVKGRFEAGEALRRVLAGSGLVATIEGSGAAITESSTIASTATSLKEVRVVDSSSVEEGGAEVGYKINSVKKLGPWTDKQIVDLPYSISVIPRSRLENSIVSTPDDLLRQIPSVSINTPSVRGFSNFSLRGFNNLRAILIDGFQSDGNSGYQLEQFERIEVLTGLSGFLYGAAPPGGLINYVIKRPTSTPLAEMTVGNAGGSSWFAHADLGGPIGDGGRLSYRLNVADQDGETAVSYRDIKRNLVSAALDWRVSDGTLVQFNAAQKHFQVNGNAPLFSLSGGLTHRSFVPDVGKDWGQPWTKYEIPSTSFGAALTSAITDGLTFRAGFLTTREHLQGAIFTSPVTIRADGTFTTTAAGRSGQELLQRGQYSFADYRFETGSVHHKLTVGWAGDQFDQDAGLNERASSSTGTFVLAAQSVNDPQVLPIPAFTPTGNNFVKFARNRTSRWTIGDDVRFSDQWSALLGLTKSTIKANGYDLSFANPLSSQYDKSKTTPTASLIYKPESWVTTYITYLEGLEQGGVAPTFGTNGKPVLNAGEILPPQLSRQYEIGAKADIDGMLLTAALFQLTKAFEYTDPVSNRYTQDGKQVVKGLELGVSGRLTKRLTLVGGASLLNAEIKNNVANPALVGKTPTNIPTRLLKTNAEYDVPGMEGLTLTGGAYWTGKQFADTANLDPLPSYWLFDVGARYTFSAKSYPITLRLNITNLANKSYWISSAYIGEPRTFSFSMQVRF